MTNDDGINNWFSQRIADGHLYRKSTKTAMQTIMAYRYQIFFIFPPIRNTEKNWYQTVQTHCTLQPYN